MKKLYRIPEIGIWLLFSVLICSGYAFSFLSYAARHTQVSVFHVVLSVVICLLLAGGGVIYTKMSHHRQWLLDFSKAEWIILEGSILLLFFAGGYIFRFTDCFANIWQDGLEDTFFQYAQVVSDRVTYANPHLISRIYVGILHIACRFFGNIYEAGAALQFILQLLSTFVWYMALRKLYGRVTALLFAFGAMLLPDSIRHSVQCDLTMLLFLIYGCTVFGMAYYMKSYMPAKWRMLMEVLLGMLTAVCVLADISGMLILFGFVCTLIRKHKLLSGSFWSKWLPAMTGLFAGMLFVIVLQAGLYGICLMDSLSLQSYHGLKPVFPKSTFWYYYMERLGRHQIFFPAVFVILAYWFIRNRKRLTYIMGAGLYLFGIQLLQLDVYIHHDFLIYLLLLVLTGMTWQLYFQAGQVKEPLVTVVHFEEQPAVEVPQRSGEAPAIFIPKSLTISKRAHKPKVDYAVEVTEEQLHFDVPVEENADFDVD